MTPVHQASITNRDELEALLVGNRYKIRQLVNARDSDGRTPLHWAAEHNRAGCVRALLDAGSSINARDCEKNTPLHGAVRARAKKAIEILIRGGARTVLKDKDGYTVRDLAAERDPALLAWIDWLILSGLSQTTTQIKKWYL